MDDELDTFGRRDADLEEAGGVVRTNEHREVVVRQIDDSDRMSVGMEDVFVSDSMTASAGDDHRIHAHQVSLTGGQIATAI